MKMIVIYIALCALVGACYGTPRLFRISATDETVADIALYAIRQMGNGYSLDKVLNAIREGENLTDEEILAFKKAFSTYDRDGEGMISTRELGAVMESVGYKPTENELTDMLNEIDTDGLGEINFPDFLALMGKKVKEYEGDESLRLAFKVFDREDNGMVSIDDFRYVMENLRVNVSEHEIDDMIKDADKSRSGSIAYNDFITWISGN